MAYDVFIAAEKGSPRAIAFLAGEKKYMSDKPCLKGHLSLRYTKYAQCLECLNNTKKEGRASGRYKVWEKQYYNNNKMKARLNCYKLSPSEFNAILFRQSYKCKICKKALKGDGKTHVDHCHKTGKVRGLLCVNCNQGLGRFKDDIALIAKALAYLKDSE